VADRDPTKAFENGLGVIRIEERVGDLFEVTALELRRRIALPDGCSSTGRTGTRSSRSSGSRSCGCTCAATSFIEFRNWLLLAKTRSASSAMSGPDAPPRDVPDFGCPDTLANLGTLKPREGPRFSSSSPPTQYAATMPSTARRRCMIVRYLDGGFVARPTWWAKVL
jgi:hypothetical protein